MISAVAFCPTLPDSTHLFFMALYKSFLDFHVFSVYFFGNYWQARVTISYQKLFLILNRIWEAYLCGDSLVDTFQLLVKALFYVVEDEEVWMACPGLLQVPVYLDCSLSVFISRLIIHRSIKLLRSVSRSHKMEDCLVPPVPQLHIGPALVIQQRLPYFPPAVHLS